MSVRVIEVISWKMREPILEHSLEPSLSHMRLRELLRHIGQDKSGQRRIEHLCSAVEDELPINSHLQFAAAFFEFPGVQPAMSRQT